MKWVLCIGVYNSGLYFSIRTTSNSMRAGRIAMRISQGLGAAGGHHKSAGGYVDLSDKELGEVSGIIRNKFLKSVKRLDIPCKKIDNEEA